LLLFVAGIGYNLARGRTPDCHCFGQLHSAPAGWSTLIRNLVLAALAGVVVIFERTAAELDLGNWLGTLSVAQRIELIGGGVVLAVLAGILWLLWHILRQQGRLLLRIEATESRLGQAGLPAQGADAIGGLVASATGLPVLPTVPLAAASQRNGHGAMAVLRPPTGLKIGAAAPDFSLPDLSGNLTHLSDFRGQETLVLFWRPSCGFCQRMLPDLKAWEAQSPKEAPRLLVVSTDSVESNQAMGLRSSVVLDQTGMSIGSQFGASGTPMAVLVDAEGRIASELVAGAPAVLALARRGQEKATLTS
jgi:peroxiredoxin